ncbi:Ulp1 family isopeptidase, partial [Bradyrhizobium sp. UFLA01-814]|uniref:Ulp1 family isopeptidase n=1 Tax=Bradyrhizobium sp. UFLA01-814 TaxID=3023480 RepID=UPI00398B034C
SFVDLNAPTPSELHDDADFAPAHPARPRSDTYSGLESFVDLNAPTPSELHDDADFAPAHPARPRSGTYSGLASFVDLNAPTPRELRDDAHYAPSRRTTVDGQIKIGALDPTATSRGHNGLELGAVEWLGDEHIQGDYELLAQELQRDHPQLAARTNFVDPLIAHYRLRFGEQSDMLRAFQRIVYDPNGNDTADFLFLPVNDATDPKSVGKHWSLLLLDRRTRREPVAYHYDSVWGHNHEAAAQLARRLCARLESPVMAQQRNSYDCGVFVVDGTRALVRRLAQGEWPERLHLDNLVVNRQSLQDRLRAHPGLR